MESPRFASNAPEMTRPRRVMTAPVPASTSSQQPRPSSPSPSSRPAPSGSDDLVETLYNHPSVRIISFTSSRHGFTTSLPAPSDNDVPPGSLPPSSRLERTIAIGAFRIYRAPGSVAFISCGSALQPILPKSQCWCINEDNSRFVLQIRRPQYWRIEVPVADPDDMHRAVLLRDVFDKILLFEKTECPFERSFAVELPDPPETPVKKKAWTAEGKNLISSPFESDLSPPAHAPTAISRGKRATSINRDVSPTSTESSVVDEAHDKAHDETHDEAHDEVRLRTRNHSFGDVLSYFKMQLNTDVPSDDAPVGSYTYSSRDNYRLMGALAQTATDSLTLKGNVAGDSTAPPSVPNYSPTSPGALQLPEVLTPGSSLAETEILREETRAHLVAAPSLDLAAERLAIKEGNQSSISDRKDDDILEPIHSDGEDGPASFEGSGGVAPVNLTRKRVTRMLAGRSFTAPAPPTLAASPAKLNKPITARKESQPPPSLAEVQSPSASTDSFHSVQSRHSSVTPPQASPGSGESSSKVESVGLPQSPSPATYSPSHITTPKNAIHVVPSSSVLDSCSSAEPTPRPIRFITDEKSKESIHSESEPRVSRESPVEHKIRFHRRRSHAGTIGRRALSPLPSAANLFTPPRQTPQSRLAAVRRLPAAIVHKTVEILLSPPSYLVSLMLKVAAMIVAGEWRGLVFGFGEAGEQIPVQWDYYSDGEFSDLSDSDDCTPTTHSSGYSGTVPRAAVRRRTKWANDDNCYGSSVD
ncbi:inheritance of peroxisomes protein 1-domain-containing protein [Xylaria castorea]|nr:inheritance of peroxisomes protein 1-domain-containing protein [Xylaria castorea]